MSTTVRKIVGGTKDKTQTHFGVGSESTTSTMVVSGVLPRSRRKPSSDVAAAVFSYIRARRALGHTRINSADIASALDLDVRDVENAIAHLSDKGVRVVK